VVGGTGAQDESDMFNVSGNDVSMCVGRKSEKARRSVREKRIIAVKNTAAQSDWVADESFTKRTPTVSTKMTIMVEVSSKSRQETSLGCPAVILHPENIVYI